MQLTYDEAVEPRFAIISVTNAAGQQETTGPVNRSPANPDTLVVPLRPHLPEGWYLIYWRAISVDGHPVQGAFTYAVGPNPGPAPQFPVPSISATATTPQLLIARWVMFLSVMVAIGLFVLRLLIARPVLARVPGASLRAVSVAFVVASVLGLIAIPVYLDFATANDSLRSVFDVGALVPLFRVTAFGRGYVDMSCASRCSASPAWIALWVDRPDREHRSIAELRRDRRRAARRGRGADRPRSGRARCADLAARVCAAVRLAAPGRRARCGSAGWSACSSSGRASRRGGGSRRWRCVVPRFSNVAFVSVLVLLGAGTWATIDPHAGAQRAVGDRLRRGDPGQDGLLGAAVADRVGQPAAHQAAARRRTRAPRARRASRAAAAPARQRRGGRRRRRGVRGGGALEPRAAATGVRAAELRARQRRARHASPRPSRAPATCCRCSSRRTRPPRRTRSRCGSPRTASPSAAPT